MLRFTVAQMRLSLPRLVAGGLAIVIGTAFIAATLLANDVMSETTRRAVTASFADADLVVTDALSPAQYAALAKVDGVGAVSGSTTVWADVIGPKGASSEPVNGVATDPSLEPQTLGDGAWPVSGEIALPRGVAARFGVGVGDSVRMHLNWWQTDDRHPEGVSRELSQELTVSGLLDDPAGAFSETGGQALAPRAAVLSWARQTAAGGGVSYSPTLVRVFPGVNPALVAAAATSTLRGLPHDGLVPHVRTLQQQADHAVAEFTGTTTTLVVLALGFGAVALIVAALVISNTFQILVAQRTRTLALLRCVGAVKAQVRRSVLQEALIVGLGASLLGLLFGGVLAQGTLIVLRAVNIGVPLPPVVAVRWPAVVVPLIVGTLVTVLAAMVPARAATRVAPLEAMRPRENLALRRGGAARLALSVLLVITGAVALAGGVWLGTRAPNPEGALAIGLLGGAVSFAGILVGAVFWVPGVAQGIGRLLSLGGVASVRLAAVNAVRNPRRTAATTSALLIGVTLVALMATGAATTRATLTAELSERYPVDVTVGEVALGDEDGGVHSRALDDAQLSAVRRVDGVGAVMPVPSGAVQIRWATADAPKAPADVVISSPLQSVDARAAALLQNQDARDALAANKVVLSNWPVQASAGSPPTTVEIAPLGPGAPHWRRYEVAWQDLSPDAGMAPPGVIKELGLDTVASQAWVELEDDAAPAIVVPAVQDALATVAAQNSTAPASVAGIALQRTQYDRVINVLLAIVVGLLGVAVVIAVVGVANTLSLSVIERRRESATLRAIGLTRRQLRWSLATEGMVIAAVGAFAGVLLGLGYGWIGARTVLGGVSQVHLAVPVRDLTLTIAVAMLAGLLASVLPSRSAARSSPIAALAD